MSRQLRIAAAIALALLSPAAATAQTVLFSDGMSSAANWTIHQTADTANQFGFDYSALGIPPAPRGGDTIGLKLEANNSPPNSTAPHESIVARHADAAFTGQYTLRVDIWNNYAWAAGGAGTTEHAGAGVGHNGVATGANGATFLFSGDGMVAPTSTPNGDYALYKDAALLSPTTGQYAAGTAGNANKDNGDPLYANAFPVIDILTTVPSQNQNASATQLVGSGGFQWMTVNIEVDTTATGPSGAFPNPGFARISMRSATSKNAIVIGTIDNSQAAAPVNLSGAVALILHDQFGSVTTNAALDFTVYDNVKVFAGLVPLPAANAPGDFNNDGDVDSDDFLAWQRGESPNLGSDQDFADWSTNWPQPFLAAPVATSVPEPAALSLLTLAALALNRRPCPRRRWPAC
jgi:hypothetical protein